MKRALAAMLVVAPSIAHAQPAKRSAACIAAAEKGQERRDKGALVEARAELLKCADPSCPALMQTDCAAWLAAVEARTPSVVFVVRRAAIDGGGEVTPVRVREGERDLGEASASAIPLDPGPHAFELTAQGATLAVQVVLREGEKAKRVEGVLPPTHVAAAPIAERGGVPALVWISGGLTVAAAGAFAVLGATGASDYGALQQRCGTSCDPADADVKSAHVKLIGADVALTIGVVSAGVFTWRLVDYLASKPPSTARFTPSGAWRF